MIDRSDVAWSCLVDDTPEIWSSIVPWLGTAIELARIEPSRIHVHHVCPLRPRLEELCHRLKINTRKTETFDLRFPHTNKIRQCATAFTDAKYVILTDVDVVFAGRPPLDQIRTPVAGKLVDEPNPPVEILRKIFSISGLPAPRSYTHTYCRSQKAPTDFETFAGNHNGGVLVFDRAHLAQIGQAWAHWARWLIGRVELLGRWSIHVDQVSFCLAVNQLGLDVGLLDETWNYPLHLNVASGGSEPFLLHHHAFFEDNQLLKQVSTGRTRDAIARVNDAIKTFRRKHLRDCAESGATSRDAD